MSLLLLILSLLLFIIFSLLLLIILSLLFLILLFISLSIIILLSFFMVINSFPSLLFSLFSIVFNFSIGLFLGSILIIFSKLFILLVLLIFNSSLLLLFLRNKSSSSKSSSSSPRNIEFLITIESLIFPNAFVLLFDIFLYFESSSNFFLKFLSFFKFSIRFLLSSTNLSFSFFNSKYLFL